MLSIMMPHKHKFCRIGHSHHHLIVYNPPLIIVRFYRIPPPVGVIHHRTLKVPVPSWLQVEPTEEKKRCGSHVAVV